MDQYVEHSNIHRSLDKEQQRLEGNHEVQLYHMEKAVYAPIDFTNPGLKVLDSACANGRWLLDLRASSPVKHEYFGTDINEALYPAPPPEGMHFQNQSIKEDFPVEWRGRFDLVHQRFAMIGSVPRAAATVVQEFVRLLKPGGWLQLVETSVDPDPNDPPMFALYLRMLSETFTAVGPGNFAIDFKSDLENAGLEHVQEKRFNIAHGETIGDKALKQKSIDALTIAVPSILQVFKTFPNTFTEEDFDGFEDKFRTELEGRGGYLRHIVVWGQKPSEQAR